MRRRTILFLAICNLLIIVITACGGGTTASGGSGNEVHTQGRNFVQSSVTINKGSSLTIIDDDGTPHIIQNGTWSNGVAKPGRESGAPSVNVQLNGNG